jgi:hypothetical protein
LSAFSQAALSYFTRRTSCGRSDPGYSRFVLGTAGSLTERATVACLAALASITIAVALAHAGSASADTFCVAPKQDPECTQTFTGLQAALDAANPSPATGGRRGGDKILIGPGDFTDGPFCYVTNDPLEIVGEGTAQTLLTMSGAAQPCNFWLPPAVLTLSNLGFFSPGLPQVLPPHIGLSNVAIRIPGADSTAGLALEGAFAHDVEVTSDPSAIHPTGVSMQGIDASFLSGTISLPLDGSVGVRTAALESIIAGSRVTAVDGVISRPVVSGAATVINSSLIRIANAQPGLEGPPAGLLVFGTVPPSSILLFVRNATVYGSGRGDDVGAELVTDPATAGQVIVASTVLDNVGVSLARKAAEGAAAQGDATLDSFFSSYSAPIVNDHTGTGDVVELGRVPGPPGFVSPSTGDFRLTPGSPLIDAGDALSLAFFESPLDLGGAPRLLDGTIFRGDERCEPRRDVGAFEFVPSTLLARASAPANVVAGQPVEFDASGSCDPDPAASLAYSWMFDDGGDAGGERVRHTFDTPGSHTTTVKVTSSGGRSASATVSVQVQPAAAAGLGASTGGPETGVTAQDTKSPRAHRLDIRPVVFRAAGVGASIARSIGAIVRYRLSEPAKTRFTVERLVRHRHGHRFVRLRGSFRHQGRKDSNKFHFTGRLAARKLRPGHYRLVGVPRDAAGNKGRPVRARFRIVRR